MMALSLPVPVVAANTAPIAAKDLPAPGCPRTSSYEAATSSIYRGAPLAPRKLTQLPPSTTYMAVYRRINGCEAPLTMVEYRSPRRP